MLLRVVSRELVVSIVVAPVGMQTVATFIRRQVQQGSVGPGMAMAYVAIAATAALPRPERAVMRRRPSVL